VTTQHQSPEEAILSQTIDTTLPEPDLQVLPLDAWHRAQGGRMVPFADYSMPVQYEGGIMAEHLWTRQNAGLFDVSHMGQLMVTGDGAAEALEALLPSDIKGLAEGQMRYSLLLNEDGGILDDLMVTRAPLGYFVVVNGAVKNDDMAHLIEHLPDDVTLNVMDDRALLALQGPRAAEVLSALVPAAAKLYFMQADLCLWGEVPLWISRSGYTGEDGFEISIAADEAQAFVDALCAHEAVKPIGLGARDSLRLEAGLPLYGHDLDEGSTPVEGALTFALSKRRREEANFLGAANVLAQYPDNAPRRRVGLAVEGKMPVREGALLFVGDAEVGNVTSGGFAPSVGAPIAMGYVAAQYAAEGTALEAEVRGKRVPVTVAPLVRVTHNYHRKPKV
jgi:aminomethyltransferase